jgi:hypothetical protein
VKVIFEGDPPFHLPLVQSATAAAVDSTVELTLYALIDGQGSHPVPMRAQMTWPVAQQLAGLIYRAAMTAESKARS